MSEPVIATMAGWEQRENHLVDYHGMGDAARDHLTSADARKLHIDLHNSGQALRRHRHAGGQR